VEKIPVDVDPRSIIIGIPGQDTGVAAMFLFDRLDFKGQQSDKKYDEGTAKLPFINHPQIDGSGLISL